MTYLWEDFFVHNIIYLKRGTLSREDERKLHRKIGFALFQISSLLFRLNSSLSLVGDFFRSWILKDYI